MPIEIREVPTGTAAFDWQVPPEWNVRDAYVADGTGRRVIDFRRSNLHLVNGSVPVDRVMAWSALRPHLHTLPDQPERIPYRTAFFREEWGFCLAHDEFDALERAGERSYRVVVDTSVEHGSLTYGECVLPGEDAGRGAAVGPSVPPLAGQRQTCRACASPPCWRGG